MVVGERLEPSSERLRSGGIVACEPRNSRKPSTDNSETSRRHADYYAIRPSSCKALGGFQAIGNETDQILLAVHTQLAVDATHMGLHRAGGHAERIADIFCISSPGQHFKNLVFTLGEAEFSADRCASGIDEGYLRAERPSIGLRIRSPMGTSRPAKILHARQSLETAL